MKLLNTLAVLALSAGILSCNNEASKETGSGDTAITGGSTDTTTQIEEEGVTIQADTATLNSFVAYNANAQDKRPIVLVIHEWWGLNDYTRSRARQLAQLGYFAMAVDLYGSGRTADNPESALSLAMPFYRNPQMAKARIDAALAKARTYPQADTAQTAAIGYCFGGSMVLNAANMGSDLDGAVSFHGGLEVTPPQKDKLTAKYFIAHGAADSNVPEAQVQAFRKAMDSAGANYTFKAYSNATHAFTNPEATETGKKFKMPIRYNAAADTASWNDMKAFFGTIFRK